MIENSRRTFLKSTGVVVGTSGIPSSSTTAATNNAMGMKGTLKNPLKGKGIAKERKKFFKRNKHRLESPDSVATHSFEGNDDKLVAGYGLAIDNGIPVEEIYYVPDFESTSETSITTESSPEVPERSLRQNVNHFHDKIDQFVASKKQRTSDYSTDGLTTNSVASPEPGWNKQGEINQYTPVYYTYIDGSSTEQVARIDLDTEIWKSGDEVRSDQDKYACPIHGEMWPSMTLDHVNPRKGFRNWSSDLIENWKYTTMDDTTGAPSITDYDPTRPKEESINMTLTVTSAGGASLSIDWDAPFIGREDQSQPDESVFTHFYYPTNIDGADGQREHVPLYNIGECWLDSAHESFDQILQTKFIGDFKMIGLGSSEDYHASDTLAAYPTFDDF